MILLCVIGVTIPRVLLLSCRKKRVKDQYSDNIHGDKYLVCFFTDIAFVVLIFYIDVINALLS